MRILVLGAGGFIGGQLTNYLATDHDVWGGKLKPGGARDVHIDLLNKATIKQALKTVRPEAVINCAGVVENSPKAKLNIEFTRNLLEVIEELNLELKRIVISGSAAEYGVVENDSQAIPENAPLNAKSEYGKSKLRESQLALKYQQDKGFPIVVARIFNPIGLGMHPRFIVPNILAQIEDIKLGGMNQIKVSRLDAKRDYIDVRDIAGAIQAIIENTPADSVYNVGSGISTSNQTLIELLVKYSGLAAQAELVQTEPRPEQPIASKADISRIRQELGWAPRTSIEQSIKDITHDQR